MVWMVAQIWQQHLELKILGSYVERLKEVECVLFEKLSNHNNPDSILGEYGCSTHALDREQRLREMCEIQIPKFKIESGCESLTQVFSDLGISKAFSPVNANFEGISPLATQHGLHISTIIHRAMIAVDEDGTVAAASTAVGGRGGSRGRSQRVYSFIINRPFLFILKHERTSQAVFIGRCVKPE